MSIELTSNHGIRPSDEGAHPYDPAELGWNESWFHDWTSPDGTEAGHCRVGWMPNRERVWVWLFLRRGEDWLGVECPDLPATSFDPATQTLQTPALTLSRAVHSPLAASTLSIQTTVRRLSGAGAGQSASVKLSLRFDAVGPPHTTGESVLGEHDGVPLTTNRFEQPVRVRGTISIDGDAVSMRGRGERDHSWGPRDWRMHWTFLALNGMERQLQAADVELFPGMTLQMGYLQEADGTRDVEAVAFDLDWPDDPTKAPQSGRLTVRTDDGAALSGVLTVLGSTPIDLSSVLQPSWRHSYHRSQVRFVPTDGGEPVIGWLEHCRFVDGLATVLADQP